MSENDNLKYADELVKLLKGMLAHVNLIPINEIKDGKYIPGVFKWRILPEKTEVSRVLEKALSDYYAVFRGCRIVPEISLPEHAVWRMGNEKALQRVFGNILSNAVKYSKGDLKIRMTEAGEVFFSNRAPELDVTKAGRLLERYFTLNQGRDASGLGLSIARTLTEQMQGKLEAKYRNGELQIRLWLPDVPEE